MTFPDGTAVVAASFDGRDPYGRDEPPDHGLYFDECWQPPWPHDHVDWPDFGTPDDPTALMDAAYDRRVPRTDRATRIVHAPVDRVFDALVRREALERWLPPGDMTGRFERFDPRPGGSYRLVLTYLDPTTSKGKSSAGSDVVEVRYLDIVPNDRVVQAADFVAYDPKFAGTMTMTWSVTEEPDGTRVEIVADDVPDGISAEDHAVGMASSLANLARFVES